MSARIDTVYFVAEDFSSCIYTAAGGWDLGNLPDIPEGTSYGFQVELHNLEAVPNWLTARVKDWNGLNVEVWADDLVPGGDTAFVEIPGGVMPKRDNRTQFETWTNLGRQERLETRLPWTPGNMIYGGEQVMSDYWEPEFSGEERRQRHYERYGTYEVPERQYRRRVGQAGAGIKVEHVLIGLGLAAAAVGFLWWLRK